MEVEKHINDLLFEHDCVIIPHFGGFVGNYRSAKLDKTQNKFSPPSKEIGFNKNLTHNDGLLANRISVSEKVSFEEANGFLAKYTENLKRTLKLEKRIELKKIGVFYSDNQQNLQFEPDYSTNYLIDSFGLASFHSPVATKTEFKKEPSLREKTAEIKFTDRTPVNSGLTKELKGREISSGKRIIKYLAYSASAIPLLVFLLWIPFNIEKINHIGQKAKTINYSNLIPFIEKNAPAYSERKKADLVFLPDSLPMSNYFPSLNDTTALTTISLFEEDEPEFSKSKKIIVKLKEWLSAEKQTRAPESKIRNRFHIIGGCFQYRENAERLVQKLRDNGFNAAIVDKHRGLFRVCYQSFPTRNDALSLLAQVRNSSNNNAWLLVK